MSRALAVLIISLIIPLVVFSSGCIGGKNSNVVTTTMEITKTVTETTTAVSEVTQTKTISTYYITTVYTTKFDTVTIPITTTIIISGDDTSTVINSNGQETTLMNFVAQYIYEDVPFLVYSISGNIKIVTIPQTDSQAIDEIVTFIHESIENKYTSYQLLRNYIGDFDTLRLKIMLDNYTDVTTSIDFSDLYYNHQYNSIYGALYMAAYAINSHRPVSIIFAVEKDKIIDAFVGFDNKYYSKDRIMYLDALKYSWYTEYGPYTMMILVLDENGIITRLDKITITNVPENFKPFDSFINYKNYGFEIVITSKEITKTVSYFIQLGHGIGTVWTTVDDLTEITILNYRNNILTMTTIKPTIISGVTETITDVNSYFSPPYYSGLDVFEFFPQNGIDYNARVINGVIMYTIYKLQNNTLTIYDFTISDTMIMNANYYEVAIGNFTVASGTIAGWVN